MPRKKSADIRVCPTCGALVEKPEKTWHITSPLPDSEGRITITVMASFACPNCGTRWRGVLSKIKAGGEGVEVEGSQKASKMALPEKSKRPGEVIELDIDEILKD